MGREEGSSCEHEVKETRETKCPCFPMLLWQSGKAVVAQQAGWVLNCVALSPEQSPAAKSPAAELLRYPEQSPLVIVG